MIVIDPRAYLVQAIWDEFEKLCQEEPEAEVIAVKARFECDKCGKVLNQRKDYVKHKSGACERVKRAAAGCPRCGRVLDVGNFDRHVEQFCPKRLEGQ